MHCAPCPASGARSVRQRRRPARSIKGDAENPLTLLVKAIQGTSIKPVPTPALPRAENDDVAA